LSSAKTALNIEYGAGERLIHLTEETEATATTGPVGADVVEGEAPAEGSGTKPALAPAPIPRSLPIGRDEPEAGIVLYAANVRNFPTFDYFSHLVVCGKINRM
jgi:hypothetical protein